MLSQARLKAGCLLLAACAGICAAQSGFVSFALNGRPLDLCASPDGEALYCASEGGTLYAFAKGAQVWRVDLPEKPRRAAVDFDGTILVLSTSGRVTRYNRQGRAVGSFSVEADQATRLAAGLSGRIFLVDGAGRVSLIGPTGRRLWRVRAGAAPAEALAVDEDGLLTIRFPAELVKIDELGEISKLEEDPGRTGREGIFASLPPAVAGLYADALVYCRPPSGNSLWFAGADWVLHRFEWEGGRGPAAAPRQSRVSRPAASTAGGFDERYLSLQLFSSDALLRQSAQAELESRLAGGRLERSLGYIGRLLVKRAQSAAGLSDGSGAIESIWAMRLLADLGEYGLFKELAAGGWREADPAVKAALVAAFGRFGGDPEGRLAGAAVLLFINGGIRSETFIDSFIEAAGAWKERRAPELEAGLVDILAGIAFGSYPSGLRARAERILRK